ncbi:MAG: type II toxin-antitoxin system RelE/ParE family toxin [Chloroflexi bacterium]|nr:type II toxin-antitoxin system RelE/ParE family toxin [Chloroflexota bacterium]
MSNEQHELFPTQIFFAPEFERNLKQLAKKYRHIKSDLSALIEQLQNRELPGDRVPGTNYHVYKVRVKNSDLDKGKRSGYRVIYYSKEHNIIYLLTIYAKSDQPDISKQQIEHIIRDI